ncbi:MAG: hypothetical protein RLZZ192_798, partial [Pseudomonadota bacterium]
MSDVVTVTEAAGASYTWASGTFTWSSASAGKNWDSAYPAVYAFAVAVSISMFELAARQFTKPVSEAITVFDDKKNQIQLQRFETLGLNETYTDLIAYVLRFVESVSILENLSKNSQKPIDESWLLVDYLSHWISKDFTSPLVCEDNLYRRS